MSEDEFRYRRVFRAPRELVWRCLTEPAELARFWGPQGMTTPLDGIVVELRAGGRFETLMAGEHGSHRMQATFTEVVAPERRVPEPMRSPEARAGFLSSLDKLADHLADLIRQEHR